ERCRMVSKEIGEDPDHPELCPRCAGIVKTYYQN
ncbi:zinc finger domain-containing protein, partial [Bacillus licheniformis]